MLIEQTFYIVKKKIRKTYKLLKIIIIIAKPSDLTRGKCVPTEEDF